MKAVGYVKKDWLESPLLGNLKVCAAAFDSPTAKTNLNLEPSLPPVSDRLTS